ncbi:MAG: chemotaxis protein CheA [Gammaproteobacteria bacterium]|nr:chemotaxis protein CheA [Gammaproteobacteria bacterium]
MSIDISQFIQTFLEESFEGLDSMESLLLSLTSDDSESINAIFRAAHSIKGGAGTFGFSEVARFTHGVETLLDEARAGRRAVTTEMIALLLESVDCIHAMLEAARDGSPVDAARIATIGAAIEASLRTVDHVMLDSKTVDSKVLDTQLPEAAANSHAAAQGPHGWRIVFIPEQDVMRSGNDPLRLIAALRELGVLQVACNTSALPPFEDLNAEDCYLSWEMTLLGEVNREAILEIFEWVEGQCELIVEPLSASAEVVDEMVDEVPHGDNNSAQACPNQSLQASGSEPPSLSVSASASSSAKPAARNRADNGSIRVNTDKIDALINMVGELVITQSMLSQMGSHLQTGDINYCIEGLLEGLAQLERNTRELQENVMSIRMLPISFAFNRFPRMIHDLSASLGKQLKLKLSGEHTELDKNVLEKITDPLVHLVRNAVDHGIESPDVRLAAGKPAVGTVHLNAYHKGGNIVIEITDDGAGLNRQRILAKAVERRLIPAGQSITDEQIHDLIFAAGFSTAEVVSDVSGRGVGMDVVRKNIKALGGSVEVQSRDGLGSTFIIRLPLTLSIMDGQLIGVSGESYVIPLISIVESLQVREDSVKSVASRGMVYRLRDEYIPVLFLHELLGIRSPDTKQLTESLLVVVEADGQRAALVVDDLLGQQQVVIKALETNFKKVGGLSGATILGDGTVALILDVSGLISLSRQITGPARSIHPEENKAA